jgi:hypothetical protein
MARKVASSLQALRVRTAVNVAIQIALVTLIVGMLNYISFNHFGRWDLSRSGKYALSGVSRFVEKRGQNLCLFFEHSH